MSFQIAIQQRYSGGFTLDLDVDTPAKAIALWGPSGCGKTTVLRLIAGVETLQAGRIVVGDRVLGDTDQSIHLAPRTRRVGWVDQDGTLFPLLDVRGNLAFGMARGDGTIDLGTVARMLEVDHLLDRQVRYLSGGERQRVALGRALLSSPDLLLCDEPFAPLDEARRDRLVLMLQTIRETWPISLVLVSHRRSEVESLADEVIPLEPEAP